MSVFQHPEFDRHESVHYFEDREAGLRAIIAIHSTALGPAAGGCRRWTYACESDALTDALRLSRGMTYKNAVAGLPFGGGKAVILTEPGVTRTAAQFLAFGRAVDSLAGRYITAEDVGVSVEDMKRVHEVTPYVSGLPKSGHDAGGDPSPWTALGVFLGLRAAVETRLGTDSLNGVRVAVQGAGHVGLHLCRLLHEAGAELFVADIDADHLKLVCDELPATVVPVDEVLECGVDVLAPCALGGILDAQTIPRLRARVIAGAANNQLATEADGERLAKRDILYTPDYVLNAGGIISVAREYLGHSSEEAVRTEVERIPMRLKEIFDDARSSGKPTNVIADQLARHIVGGGKPLFLSTTVGA